MPVGNVQLKGDNDTVYTLNFGVNAMCRLEAMDPQHRSYREILEEMRTLQPSMRTVRLLVAAAMVEPKDPTLEQAGDIIEDIGGTHVVLVAWKHSDDTIVAIGEEIAAAMAGWRGGPQPSRSVN